jgi:predicted NUDIX family NTP pyrophosphohydrolase
MAKQSAGVLVFRIEGGRPHFLLVHPGGPFWARKDEGSWSIPKGEFEDGRDARSAALRELAEETGIEAHPDDLVDLGSVRQRSGKVVHAWALERDFDVSELRSNTFEMEWPRGSGIVKEFPEVDRADWFLADTAREKLLAAQTTFIDRLLDRLTRSAHGGSAGRTPP